MSKVRRSPSQTDDSNAPLSVYDRFASSSRPSATNLKSPSGGGGSRSAKAHGTRGSVLDTFQSTLSPPPAIPLTSNSTKQPKFSTEQSIREEVASVKSAKSTHHKRDTSELTLSPGASAVPVPPPPQNSNQLTYAPRRDKASSVLGIPHRQSMEPIPARKRTSIMSTRSAQNPAPPSPAFAPTMPLASLYVVSGLPKRPQTWTLADPDAVQGLSHSEGAVGRWWRAEVLGSTVSPGVGGGKKKKVMKGHTTQTEISKGPGALTKQETAKMLSKALKLSFTREVEIIASTLQPASTVHTFTFTLPPSSSTPLAPPSTIGLSAMRNSVLSSSTDNNRLSNALTSYGTFPYSYNDGNVRPSSAYLGPASVTALNDPSGQFNTTAPDLGGAGTEGRGVGSVTYHGVCLTVWSHADAERSTAIRRALESVRSRKESAQSVVASRLKALRGDTLNDPASQARKSVRSAKRGPWSVDAETDAESEYNNDAISESEYDVASTTHGPGESTLFLTGDTVFWLPYALTLISRHPIYDLMRDYLTLSWARFSKDVASHTLQISKILSHPAPRAGEIIRLDASPKEGGEKGDGSLEVVARFPGGLDFGRGLVDINYTMWPLFKCLNIDNILSICEIALAPTGRVLFFSRHPAMLGIAVATIKYLVELRGWNGIALPAVHARDARIYIEDPGPYIIGMSAEMRYAVRIPPDVCVCDLDINYLSCSSPPPNCLSTKQQRERYRHRLVAAFGEFYHPDHSVPIEFKEAFPAGRFRPICKIQAKRGASSSVVAESVKVPEWWHSTRIIQAFDSVLQDKCKKPSLLKRIPFFGGPRRPPRLSEAEQQIQHSIRKRATAFVDARDDLETKIGRLSRRLNFLMTESDLWREKFVTFEQYAEKLSTEASELRSKISKEQRESKRLTGIVTHSVVEKQKLETQLVDKEAEHKQAMVEMERLRNYIEKMEVERSLLVAEVEAQIERALIHMALPVDMSDSEMEDGGSLAPDSRPGSRLSTETGGRHFPPRSISTESTLAETMDMDEIPSVRHSVESSIPEMEERDAMSETSHDQAANTDKANDAMNAVDENIHQNSDRIAQSMLQIQQKLEYALAVKERRMKYGRASLESENENSDRPISPATTKVLSGSEKANRSRSGTVSSSQTTTRVGKTHNHSTRQREHSTTPKAPISPATDVDLNKKASEPPLPSSTVTSPTIFTPVSSMSYTPSTPSVTIASTEDSDTDFQSAYSVSPRESFYETEGTEKPVSSDSGIKIVENGENPSFLDTGHYSRERASSASTAKTARHTSVLN